MTRGPQKQFDRQEVLERAMELFWTQGYEATGMAQLLQCMGIGRQSLYDTFGDKKSLFTEALEHYFQQRMEIARQVLQQPGSPISNLQKLFETMMQIAEQSDHCGCFIGNSLAEFGRRDPEMRQLVSHYLDRMKQTMREVLQQAQQHDELPPDAPIEDLATVLVITTQGLALLSKAKPEWDLVGSLFRTSFTTLQADGA